MERIRIVEVGPRDGLQNEPVRVPADLKVAFVDELSRSGVDEIEVTAFVSPQWIPQLADAEEVLGRIRRRPGVTYSALVPNERGLARALLARPDKFAVFTAASETFNRKNINTSVRGSIERFVPVVREAGRLGLPVRGYVSTAFFCPYEGAVDPGAVVEVVDRLTGLGVEEVSVADTVGKASHAEVRTLLDLLVPRLPPARIAMHFHDTFGQGVGNVLAALEYGVRTFDASVGGLGGCPYAPGATGNVATEKVIPALRQAGFRVDVDLAALEHARGRLAAFLADAKRTLPPDGTAACASCEYGDQSSCCGRERH